MKENKLVRSGVKHIKILTLRRGCILNRLKDSIFYIIVWGAVVLLGFITLLSAFKSGPASLKLPFYSGFAFILAAGLVIFIFLKANLLYKINLKVFLVVLALLALIPRLVWIYFIRTQPFSDFLHLYNYGVNASNGDFKGFVDFYAVFPFKMSFGLALAGLYSVFGTGLLVAKLFNVIISVCLVFIVYAGGKLLYGEKAARISGLLLALWPADIMFTSVIASEHLFLVLFTGAVVLILNFIQKYSFRNYGIANGNLSLLAIGLLTALAQLIRPMAMLLLPVFAVYVLLFKQYRADSLASLGLKVKSILLVFAAYYMAINLINIPVQKVTGVDVTRSDSGFNLLVGTNDKANGMFNDEDFSIIAKYDYDIDRVHAEARKIAIERITSNPQKLPGLFLRKIDKLWGNENYGYYWSTTPVKDSMLENTVKSYPRVFYGISQAFYVLVMLMGICACFYNLREKRYDVLIVLMIFGGIFLSYLLLEVQSRYHLPVMPLLILLGGSFLEPAGDRFQ